MKGFVFFIILVFSVLCFYSAANNWYPKEVLFAAGGFILIVALVTLVVFPGYTEKQIRENDSKRRMLIDSIAR